VLDVVRKTGILRTLEAAFSALKVPGKLLSFTTCSSLAPPKNSAFHQLLAQSLLAFPDFKVPECRYNYFTFIAEMVQFSEETKVGTPSTQMFSAYS
jgi:hypothetical protein